MRTAHHTSAVQSEAWEAATPLTSVVVATHNRAGQLSELIEALDGQTGCAAFEVIIVDDGSTDQTWEQLSNLAGHTTLALKALRIEASGGPSIPRNTGAQVARGERLAFTDDDCIPSLHWLAALHAAAGSAAIVQGATLPAEHGRVSPWDRTIEVTRLSGLWESCNVAVRREVFEAAGGFPVLDLLPAAGRGFGEDTVLGAAVAERGGGTFAVDAVVRHRWEPGSYASHLEAARRLEALPALIREVPSLRAACYLGRFRNRRSAALDLALAGLVAATVSRRPAAALAALPWVVVVARSAQARFGRPVAVRVAQEAFADLVTLKALAVGSLRSRTPLG